jgi:hypothetical protein
VEYYGCYKKGHYKSKYRVSEKIQNQVSKIKKTVDYDNFYWSACYKNYYRAYKNGIKTLNIIQNIINKFI